MTLSCFKKIPFVKIFSISAKAGMAFVFNEQFAVKTFPVIRTFPDNFHFRRIPNLLQAELFYIAKKNINRANAGMCFTVFCNEQVMAITIAGFRAGITPGWFPAIAKFFFVNFCKCFIHSLQFFIRGIELVFIASPPRQNIVNINHNVISPAVTENFRNLLEIKSHY